MARKFGKKNHVKLNLLSYNVCLLGEPKIGKTTVVKEICELLAGEDGYMFAEFGRERGADAIEGICYEDFENWDNWLDFVDDVVRNKTTDYADLKVVVVDTYDQYIDIASKEALERWNAENPDKQAKSLNGAWGGFGAGDRKAIELMFEQTDRLERVGVKVWFIGHVKNKSVSDVATGETYQVLTSDQQQNYFNALKKNLHFLGLAYIDRQIVKEKTGKKNIITKKEEFKSIVKEETRKIKFRDDSYAVDSGSRFKEIVSEIDLDAKQFIEALTDAIKAEQKKSGKTLEETVKEQKEEEEAKEKAIAKAEEEARQKEALEEKISVITDFIKANKGDMAVIKPIIAKIKELGYESSNPNVIDNIEDANIVAELCV